MQLTSFLLMAMAFVTAYAQANHYPGLEVRSRTAARKGNSTTPAGGAAKSNSTAPGGGGGGSRGSGSSSSSGSGGAGVGSESGPGAAVGPGPGHNHDAGAGADRGPNGGGAPSPAAKSAGPERCHVSGVGGMVTVAGLGVAFALFM